MSGFESDPEFTIVYMPNADEDNSDQDHQSESESDSESVGSARSRRTVESEEYLDAQDDADKVA